MLSSQYTPNKIEAGCDEAGRGCLAGPVVAAAVIFPKGYKNDVLNDSKQLSKKKRAFLKTQIKEDAICWAIGECSNVEIDQFNILKSSFMAMHKAVEQLTTTPELLLIDGNRFISYPDINHECIIKGDAKFLSIAAASVLAKTYRDDLMTTLGLQHPQYDWVKNAGYPTKKHREAIKQFGITSYHRKSFRLLPDQLDLFEEN
ncbi:MAG: ribonuclease HII [Cyclobacteriaceae bacterium]|nr:ribonuclease HII [Cyclobacteriaceae bacterium]